MKKTKRFPGFPGQNDKYRQAVLNPVQPAQPGHSAIFRMDHILVSGMFFSVASRIVFPLKIPGGRYNTAMPYPILPESQLLRCRLRTGIHQQALTRITPFHGIDRPQSGPVGCNHRHHIRRKNLAVTFDFCFILPFPHERRAVHLFHNRPQLRGFICPIPAAHTGSPPQRSVFF